MKEKADQRINIAFLQLLPGKTLEEQMEIGQKACREAKKKGAEIALFPEMWSNGYFLTQDEKALSGSDDFFVSDLDLADGGVKIGAMICFDREFPESARILMMKGAELILAPNACPMEINRLSALRTRAYENMVAVATCNYPEGQPDCNGHSTLFDGVPWLWEEPGVRDMCVFEAPGDAGVYIAALNLEKLRRHRRQDVMGDKYRRPETYGALVKRQNEWRLK